MNKKNGKKIVEKETTVLQSRRALLTGLGVGTVAAVPAKWKAPIIKAISLPAHAATTGCDTTLFLEEEFVINCGDGQAEFVTTFVVDDISEDCPFIDSRDIGDVGSDFEFENTIRFTTVSIESTIRDSLTVLIGTGPGLSNALFKPIQLCGGPLGFVSTTDSFSGDFLSLDGIEWTLSGDVVWVADTSATITNIQVELNI